MIINSHLATVLHFLAVYLQNGCIQSTPITLEKELEMFEGCTVHVVMNDILTQNGNLLGDRYEMKPLNYPVILFQYLYERTDISANTRTTMECDTEAVLPLPGTGVKFLAPPHHKSTCFVQIYIEPNGCKTWTPNPFSFEEVALIHLFDKTMTSLLSTTFDYRVQAEKNYTSLLLFRTGLYFVQVELGKPTAHYVCMDYRKTSLYITDMYWMSFLSHGSTNSAPTRFVFGIEYSTTAQSYRHISMCW